MSNNTSDQIKNARDNYRRALAEQSLGGLVKQIASQCLPTSHEPVAVAVPTAVAIGVGAGVALAASSPVLTGAAVAATFVTANQALADKFEAVRELTVRRPARSVRTMIESRRAASTTVENANNKADELSQLLDELMTENNK